MTPKREISPAVKSAIAQARIALKPKSESSPRVELDTPVGAETERQ